MLAQSLRQLADALHKGWLTSRTRQQRRNPIASAKAVVDTTRRFSATSDVLEERFLLSAVRGESIDSFADQTLPENIDHNLVALFQLSQSDAESHSDEPGFRSGAAKSAADVAAVFGDLIQFEAESRPIVNVWTRGETADVAARLTALGVTLYGSSAAHHVIEVGLNPAVLPEIARMTGVLSVTPVYRPVLHSGSVQTQGDAVLNSDDVRATGPDGSSILVGVLSDSSLNISRSQATEDLPAVIDRYLEFPATDEGRAMLEIIHDIAPGASLAHHSAILSELSFADGIRKLAAAGSRVIVDDVSYFSEPFFQDGIIAEAVNDVTANGVAYVSAAGNDANRSYQAVFSSAGALQDFDPSAAVDTRQQITVPAGTTATLILQWDDPFYTVGGVTHNFDVRIYDAAGMLVKSGTTNNPATQQPLEIVRWTGSGTGVYQVEIERVVGSGSSMLKYILSTNSAAGSIDEFATQSGTVVGHAAAVGAIAVGAVPYYSPDTIEPYSSWGDVTIYFDPAGNRLSTPEFRSKPDVVAPDNVNTTFFGIDIEQDTDTDRNFAGTSAAAPHVAGVLALLSDANPHLTRQQLTSVLTSTAVDLGSPGIDSVYGYGRVDAEAALVAALAAVDSTSPTAQLATPIITHGWPVSTLEVQFSEPLNSTTANNAANYTVAGAGIDNLFGTGDDVAYVVSVGYDADRRSAILTFTSPGITLPDGLYRLTLDATGGLSDPAGNSLNGGVDQVVPFSVATRSEVVDAEFATALDLRPDGTAVMVYPNNPKLGYAWPQIMIGQFDAGAGSQRPFVSAPTDIEYSYQVASPDVAVNAVGGVAVYADKVDLSGGGFPRLWAIGYQMIAADGRPVGPRLVAGYADGNSVRPRVEMHADGDFTIVYTDSDYNPVSDRYDLHYVRARQFDSSGSPKGDVFTVSQLAGGTTDSVVGIAETGVQIFIWKRSESILARRFNASGAPLGDEFPVASLSTGSGPVNPEIAVADDGSFVIAWSTASGIRVKRFDASGTAIESDVLVFPNGTLPGISVAADGRFVVAWQSPDGDSDGIFAQRFAADGTFVGERVRVNSIIAGSQSAPRIAMRNDGNFLISWQEANGSQARWYSWNVTDEGLPFGPWVRAMSPNQPVSGSFGSVAVTFDSLMNATTLTNADISVTDPVGRSVAVTSVTTTDSQTFTFGFGTQQLPGRYTLSVGPDVLDAAGLLMNQDGDANNGESQDLFAGFIDVAATAASFPHVESFEGGSVDALGGSWSFAVSSGAIDVISTNGPRDAFHLRMTNGTPNTHTQQEAVLKLDLSTEVGATNLSLDFWLQKLGSNTGSNFAALYVSGDGSDWKQAGGNIDPGVLNQYLHIGLDLDEILSTADVVLDADVYLKFFHNAFYADGIMTFDDIRVSNLDVFGPKTIDQTPNTLVAAPLDSFTVTFNEDIAAASFTAADVSVVDPVGNSIALAGDPVDSGDHRTFTMNFLQSQVVSGTYTFTVGPDVQDLSGNSMNQDDDAVVGETNGQDLYSGVIQVGSLNGAAFPYTQDFEDGSLTPLASTWSFAVSSGTLAVTSGNSPHGGSYHLQMTNGTPNTHTTQEGVLKLDLSSQAGATDLELDFWLKKLGSNSASNIARLSVSGDGNIFTQVGPNLDPVVLGQYVHYVYDLDDILTDVTLDSDVYLKFLHNGFYAGSIMTFDDIRISNADAIGPRVISHTPVGEVPGAIDAATVTFSEPISASSFTVDDIQVITADGKTVELAGDPVDTGDQRTFALSFVSAESLAGTYTVRVGPQVSDLAGNLMNQDQDIINGETNGNDQYTGMFHIGPVAAQPLPYTQGFESPLLTNLDGWSFAVSSGTVAVTSGSSPHGGSYHLQMTNGTPNTHTTQEGVLKLDLSSQAGATDLELDFWLQKLGSNTASNIARLSVSGDGNIFTQVGPNLDPVVLGQYVHYVYDLDDILTDVTLDSDVYLKFLHNGFYAGSIMTFDDIRISNADVFGPYVTDQNVTDVAADGDPLNSIVVTFSEAIETASLTSSTVVLKNPTGYVVPVTITEVVGSGKTQFELSFSDQNLRGDYRLQIGLGVTDLAGNQMNQDNDVIVGEASDFYSGTVTFAGTVWSPPGTGSVLYAEDFEHWSTDIPSYWRFQSAQLGTISDSPANSPYLGQRHLFFDHAGPSSTYPTMSGILAVDLSAQASRDDLVLDFWAKRANATGTTYVDLSTDGATWKTIWSSSLSGSHTHYPLDLDNLAQVNSVTLDADVYIRFRSLAGSFSSNRDDFIDNVRISTGAINNAPTLTTVNTLIGGTEGLPVTIDYATLAAAANEADMNGDPLSFRIDTVSSGLLTMNGNPVIPGTTLLSAGETFVWTPADNANGTLDAFTIRAWDGNLVSGGPVQVRVTVVAVPDLTATAFNAVSDQVVGAQTDVTFTVHNRGSIASGAFETHVVWSANNVIGDADDVVVSGSVQTFPGLGAAAFVTRTVLLALDKGRLYAHAVTANPAGNPVGTVSSEASHLFVVVDSDNTVAESNETNNSGVGHLIDSDDITWFPWDKNGNGTIEPLEALSSIQTIGTSDAASDFDGNGVVTPLEALSAIQRIGYVRNDDVIGDTPPFTFSIQSANQLQQAASMSSGTANPVEAEFAETTSPARFAFQQQSPEFSANGFALPDDDKEDLFASHEVQVEPVAMNRSNDNTWDVIDRTFESETDWLSIL